jgi:hypothetical protein
MIFAKTADGSFRRYAKVGHVPAGEQVIGKNEIEAMSLAQLQEAIALATGKPCGKLKDKPTGRTKLTGALSALPVSEPEKVPEHEGAAGKRDRGHEKGQEQGSESKVRLRFEYIGADLGPAFAEKLAEYRKLSEQRAAMVEILSELAGSTGRREFTDVELKEVIRQSGDRIPSPAGQDRWRLFRWHKPWLLEDGFIREVR